jgi:DNA-binding NarL/FixJ family response regulator
VTTVRRIRVVLAEDHEMVRQGLRSLLDGVEDVEVIGEAKDGPSAVAMVEAKGPDVVVMDFGLPGLNGADATARLKRSRPDVAVVMLSMRDDAPTVDRALRAGARGYVVKGAGVDALCEAIRSAARGEVYLSPAVSDYVLQGYLAKEDAPTDPLTAREREVLQLVAEGLTGRQVAARLGLAPKTVDNHRARILDKLGIRTTAGLVRYAIHSGLVD